MTNTKSLTDSCPRCGSQFRCGVNAVEACTCTRVSLTTEQLAAIRHYAEQAFGEYTCLCVSCLTELKRELTPLAR